jgi:hypothetical protein
MFATLQMRATETMNNAFTKKAGTVKARVAMANEVAKRCNRFFGSSDANKFQAWAIEYATNWKSA